MIDYLNSWVDLFAQYLVPSFIEDPSDEEDLSDLQQKTTESKVSSIIASKTNEEKVAQSPRKLSLVNPLVPNEETTPNSQRPIRYPSSVNSATASKITQVLRQKQAVSDLVSLTEKKPEYFGSNPHYISYDANNRPFLVSKKPLMEPEVIRDTRFLAEGSMGSVFRVQNYPYRISRTDSNSSIAGNEPAEDTSIDPPMAMKITTPTQDHLPRMAREIHMLDLMSKKLEGESIQQGFKGLIFTVTPTGKFVRCGYLTELYEGTDLFSFFETHNVAAGTLSKQEAINIVTSLLRVVSKLKEIGVFHIDIKSENVLWKRDETGTISIAVNDLEGLRHLKTDMTQKTRNEPIAYTPERMSPRFSRWYSLNMDTLAEGDPELARKVARGWLNVDDFTVCALGQIAHECFFGHDSVPYKIIRGSSAIDFSTISVRSNPGVPEDIREFIERMIGKNDRGRPTLQEAITQWASFSET